jgi:hypothetical protein
VPTRGLALLTTREMMMTPRASTKILRWWLLSQGNNTCGSEVDESGPEEDEDEDAWTVDIEDDVFYEV